MIGIDVDVDVDSQLSISESFKIRESRMVEQIKKYSTLGFVCAVVGDTHLRTIETEELGNASSLRKEFNGVKYRIIRSRYPEIK